MALVVPEVGPVVAAAFLGIIVLPAQDSGLPVISIVGPVVAVAFLGFTVRPPQDSGLPVVSIVGPVVVAICLCFTVRPPRRTGLPVVSLVQVGLFLPDIRCTAVLLAVVTEVTLVAVDPFPHSKR